MPRKNIDKRKIKELEKEISEILVVNDKDLKPYIEIFNVTPENISQKKLGTLLGFFEIKDDSDDSAYIVNFLSSVIKKEYFNQKKPVIENFEGALHKTNLALSEIAKHGNINWLGRLDSAICVLEKNNLHFTVSGNAKILLVRNNSLSDISQDLAPDSENIHPMKTFENVSSGKLEDGDKIIITTDDLFHVFSLMDIKKGALNFSGAKFIQFLKTALINELDIAGTLVIDTKEKKRVAPKKIKESDKEESKKELNVFSEKTFSSHPKINQPDTTPNDKAKKEQLSAKNNTSQEKEEYTDNKTGHIYVKGQSENKTENSQIDYVKHLAKERLLDLWFWVKTDFKDWAYKSTKKLGIFLKNSSISTFNASVKTYENLKSKAQNKIKDKIKNRKKSIPKEFLQQHQETNAFEKYSKPSEESRENKAIDFLKNLLPNFSKIKKIFTKISLKQKIYSILILLFIVIAPLVASNVFEAARNKKDLEKIELLNKTEEDIPVNPLEGEKNLITISSTSPLYNSESEIINSIYANDQLLIVSEDAITIFENNTEENKYPIPSEFGSAKEITYMEDLSLLFILTDNDQIISFSPISKKIQTNNIDLPENSEIDSMGTFLTYIYLSDSNNSQIFRYPRQEGGFGQSSPWLKENIEIEKNSDIAIDENIYLSSENSLTKLFGGQKEDWKIEETSQPINFTEVIFDSNSQSIFVLDQKNSRLIQISKEGEIIHQIYNAKIKEASSFSVNTYDQFYYLSDEKELFYFTLNK